MGLVITGRVLIRVLVIARTITFYRSMPPASGRWLGWFGPDARPEAMARRLVLRVKESLRKTRKSAITCSSARALRTCRPPTAHATDC